MKKTLLAILVGALCLGLNTSSVEAQEKRERPARSWGQGLYFEVKNDFNMVDWSHTNTVNHYRIGYTLPLRSLLKYVPYTSRGNAYFEIGPMSNGSNVPEFSKDQDFSWEAGYRVRVLKRFTLKGKLENRDAGEARTKLETELRYNF